MLYTAVAACTWSLLEFDIDLLFDRGSHLTCPYLFCMLKENLECQLLRPILTVNASGNMPFKLNDRFLGFSLRGLWLEFHFCDGGREGGSWESSYFSLMVGHNS